MITIGNYPGRFRPNYRKLIKTKVVNKPLIDLHCCRLDLYYVLTFDFFITVNAETETTLLMMINDTLNKLVSNGGLI